MQKPSQCHNTVVWDVKCEVDVCRNVSVMPGHTGSSMYIRYIAPTDNTMNAKQNKKKRVHKSSRCMVIPQPKEIHLKTSLWLILHTSSKLPFELPTIKWWMMTKTQQDLFCRTTAFVLNTKNTVYKTFLRLEVYWHLLAPMPCSVLSSPTFL